MNCITLIGRLGADPDIKYFQSGTNVAKFSIAVDQKRQGSRERGAGGKEFMPLPCHHGVRPLDLSMEKKKEAGGFLAGGRGKNRHPSPCSLPPAPLPLD